MRTDAEQRAGTIRVPDALLFVMSLMTPGNLLVVLVAFLSIVYYLLPTVLWGPILLTLAAIAIVNARACLAWLRAALPWHSSASSSSSAVPPEESSVSSHASPTASRGGGGGGRGNRRRTHSNDDTREEGDQDAVATASSSSSSRVIHYGSDVEGHLEKAQYFAQWWKRTMQESMNKASGAHHVTLEASIRVDTYPGSDGIPAAFLPLSLTSLKVAPLKLVGVIHEAARCYPEPGAWQHARLVKGEFLVRDGGVGGGGAALVTTKTWAICVPLIPPPPLSRAAFVCNIIVAVIGILLLGLLVVGLVTPVTPAHGGVGGGGGGMPTAGSSSSSFPPSSTSMTADGREAV